MNVLFADTHYYLALLNERDAIHSRALALSEARTEPTCTTAWVLTEVADALAASAARNSFAMFLADLRDDRDCKIVPASQALFDAGVDLYIQRPDKTWSLTDCISFVVMRQHGITDALTGDRHFEQAGFTVLL